MKRAFLEAEAEYTPDDYKKGRETYQALSRIRHLDTEQSRLRLRSMLGEGDGAEFAAMLGLSGTRHVDAAIQLLEKGLRDPVVPVTQNYLNVMSKLRQTTKFYGVTEESREEWKSKYRFGSTDHRGQTKDWKLLIDVFGQKKARPWSNRFARLWRVPWRDLTAYGRTAFIHGLYSAMRK